MPKRILLALLFAVVAAMLLLMQPADPRAGEGEAQPGSQPSESPSVATGSMTPSVADAAPVEPPEARVETQRAGQGILGRVLDASGKPIADAEVVAFARASIDPFSLQWMRNRGQRHASLGRATTGQDGSFAIELQSDHADARIEAHVRAPEFAPRQAFGTIRIAEWTDLGTIQLGRGRSLRGTVRDALTDSPIADAEVTIHVPSTRMLDLPPLSAKTDAQGEYAIHNAPIGICNIAASAAGHARHEMPQQHIQRDEDNVLHFSLQPGRTLRGNVVDAAGRACNGAFVRATPESARETGMVEAHARVDGSFEFEGIALGDVRLVASAPGFDTASQTVAAEHSQPVTLQIGRLVRAIVTAVDQQGSPVQGFTAVARGKDGGESQLTRRIGPKSPTADDPRTVEFDGLQRGVWEIEAWAPGFARSTSRTFRVHPDWGDKITIEISLTRGSRVLGRVVDEQGQPVAGAFVRLRSDGSLDGELAAALRSVLARVGEPALARSGPDGMFSVEHVHQGLHELSVARDGFAPRIRRGIKTEDGIDAQVGDIALAKGASIRGRALAADAVDRRIVVQIVPIDAKDLAPDFVLERRVDAEGKFRFEGLPRGRYALLAGRRDADDPFLENSDQTRSRVEVEADSAAERAVDLEVAPR